MTKNDFLLVALAVTTPLATALGVSLAYAERGYFAYGAEYLIPTFFVGIYAALKSK